jgi:hypothetical protein
MSDPRRMDTRCRQWDPKASSPFAPVSAIIYELDRRDKLRHVDGLEEPPIDPTDKKAVETEEE